MKIMPLKSSLAIIFLLTTFVSNAQKGDVIDKVVAQIGDQIILHSQIQNTKLQALSQGAPEAQTNECGILEELLYQSLLVNQAELDSIVIPEGQVQQEIDRRIQYFAAQIGSVEELENFYHMSVEEIKDEFYIEIEAKMMAQEMERTITSEVIISPKEVERFFNDLHKDSVPYINSQVTYAQILIQPEVKQKDKERTREKLDEIRSQIINEERSFSSMAALYSMDPGTAKKGGEFDYVGRGTFVPEFDATAFSLKPGEISEVFETSYGYHILQLIDRRGEQYKGKHILLIPQVGDQAIEDAAMKADSILQLIKDDKYTFSQAAEKFSDDESTKNNGGKRFHPQTGSTKWDMSELDRGTFSVLNRLEPGDISSVEFTATEEGQRAFRIVKLLSRSKPHVANLKDDYQYISTAALNYKKQRVLDEWIAKNINSAYITIKEEYRDCDYNYDWMKLE